MRATTPTSLEMKPFVSIKIAFHSGIKRAHTRIQMAFTSKCVLAPLLQEILSPFKVSEIRIALNPSQSSQRFGETVYVYRLTHHIRRSLAMNQQQEQQQSQP